MNEELEKQIEEIKAKATPTAVAGLIVKGVAKHSVAFIAASLAKTYCPSENKKQQVQVIVGAYVIGGMAGDAAANWAQHEYNEAVDFITGLFKKDKTSETEEENPPNAETAA